MPAPAALTAAMLAHLRHTNEIGRRAIQHGHHPFGALLTGPDDAVLMEQANIDVVNHAEATLIRRAFGQFTPDFLWRSTLYTNVEPCAMCAGTAYWANIGRVVFGMSETRLREITGNHPDNPTLALPSRDVFNRGHKPVILIGPVAQVADEIAALHREFWKAKTSNA